MINEEQRTKAYNESTDELRALYSGPMSMALSKEMIDKYNISKEKKLAYLDATGDVILGFNKISELPSKLQKDVGLNQEDAKALTAQLIDMWGPVVKREEEEARAKKEEMSNLADNIEAIKPAAPIEAKEKHEVAAPIKTIDSDVKKKHGYGALQSAPETVATSNDDGETVIKSISQLDLQKESTLSPVKPETKSEDKL